MKFVPFISLMLFGFNMNSQVSIIDALNLKDSILGEYHNGEYAAKEEIIDIQNGYYSVETYQEDTEGNKYDQKTLFQAAIFKNSDETITLGITEYHYDFVCAWYESHFYEISNNGDRIIEIETGKILPGFDWYELLSDSLNRGVLEKYLPEIKEGYLDDDATITDLLNEVYHVQYIMPRYGLLIEVKLTTCDYIPLNELTIAAGDWEKIEQVARTMVLHYDRKLKVFKQQLAD